MNIPYCTVLQLQHFPKILKFWDPPLLRISQTSSCFQPIWFWLLVFESVSQTFWVPQITWFSSFHALTSILNWAPCCFTKLVKAFVSKFSYIGRFFLLAVPPLRVLLNSWLSVSSSPLRVLFKSAWLLSRPTLRVGSKSWWSCLCADCCGG